MGHIFCFHALEDKPIEELVRTGSPSPFNPQSRRRRAIAATLFVVGVVGVIGYIFFHTQVVRSDELALLADENRLRAVPVPAARGAILDRDGRPLAGSVTRSSLALQSTSPDSLRAALLLLQPILALDEARVSELTDRFRANPYEPLLIAPVLEAEQLAWVEANRGSVPVLLLLDAFPVRDYPGGEAVSHLLGYVGEMTAAERADSMSWPGYEAGQLVGRAGVEAQHERMLAGRYGERYVEVDAEGRIVPGTAALEETPPIAGGDLRLSIDLELQRFVHSLFEPEDRGAVVAMLPSTGELLALYSNPTYDPNLSVDPEAAAAWEELSQDPRQPLLNRAIAAAYPPGAVWKLATAVVGLEQGVIQPDSRMAIACSGGMSYAGRYARCWDREGHGMLDLIDAIAQSCNVYFYQLGIRLGLNQLAREGTRLGFARPTGIDLPGEEAGSFPTSDDWYVSRLGTAATPGDVLSLAIGEGPNAQTPLRVAQFFAAIARGGTAPTPTIRADPDSRPIETDLGVPRPAQAALRLALARAVEPGGTAADAALADWKMYGTTASAPAQAEGDEPSAWFAGFAGRVEGEPDLVLTVLLEDESEDSAAASLAARIADFYLDSR